MRKCWGCNREMRYKIGENLLECPNPDCRFYDAPAPASLQAGISGAPEGLPDHELHRLAQLWLEEWNLTNAPYRGSIDDPGRIRKSLANLLKIVIYRTVHDAPERDLPSEEQPLSQTKGEENRAD